MLEVDRKDFTFKVGQSIGVLVPGPHEFGRREYLRLYTIANTPDEALIEICVKRCNYIDDFSGERYKGIASNYLCDLNPGDTVTLTGPHGIPFDVPEDKTADLLMIGLGTGIAPFRGFIKHIYTEKGGWQGKVRLFHGARSGLELLYMNDKKNDFAHYYDEDTFEAIEALSPRPHMDDPIQLDKALESRADEVWEMVMKPETHVYVAGLEKMQKPMNEAFLKMAGSKEKWERRKAELVAGKRWVEIIY